MKARNGEVRRPKLTFDEFVTEATLKHGDKYTYLEILPALVKYGPRRIKYRCNLCGTVNDQNISDHLRGRGCRICPRRKPRKPRTPNLINFNSFEEVVEAAKLVNEDRYDYLYIDETTLNRKRIVYRCKKCGHKANSIIRDHLKGQVCRICGLERLIKIKSIPKEDVFEEARLIHNNLYEYVDVIPSTKSNRQRRVVYICPFCQNKNEQNISDHLRGRGCRYCRKRN